MAQATRKPVDRIMPTFVDQPGAPIIKVESQCEGASTKVKLSQHRYFYDSALLQAPSQQMACSQEDRPSSTRAGPCAGKRSGAFAWTASSAASRSPPLRWPLPTIRRA